LVRVTGDVVEPCADEGGAARQGDGGAGLVVGGAVARSELLLLAPHAAGAHENVGRALVLVAADVVKQRPDQGCVAVERNRAAEEVASGAVGGGDLLLERPGRT
jgi:hypothetical protein